jgi:hypothetical protein
VAAVSALLLSSGIAAAAALVRRAFGAGAGWLSLGLLSLSPLCFALGTATLSDGAGLGAVLWAVYAACSSQVLGGGLLFGLALGLRPSYLPLGLPLLWALGRYAGWRRSLLAAGAALGGVLLWLVPLAWVVGPRALLALSLNHLHGHVYDFGGTVASDPAIGERLWEMGHGALFGAFGSVWPAGLLLLVWAGLRVWSGPVSASQPVRALLLVLLCWAAWVLIAQAVRGHARHLLPAVVALLLLLSALASSRLAERSGRVLFALLVLLVAVPSVRMVLALRRGSPPRAQLARYVASNFPAGTPLYGARAARYLDWLAGAGTARPARYLGEVIVDLERRDRPPAEVLLTSEVKAAPASRPRLKTLARFCSQGDMQTMLRFEQGSDEVPCIDLLSYRVWP